MRLIDADKLKEDVLSWENCYNGYSDAYDKARIIDAIDEQPTVDTEPIVRCKDCKYYREQGYCSRFDLNNQCPATPYSAMHMPRDADDFCSRGERKDG